MNKRQARDLPTWQLLGQTKWWVIGTSDIVKRKDMTVTHKANTVAWLVRHAEMLVSNMSRALLPAADFQMPEDVLGEWEFAMSAPETWVLSQPLVHAMLNDLSDAGL